MTSLWIHGWASDSRVFETLLAALPPSVAQNASTVDLPVVGSPNQGLDADSLYARHIYERIEHEASRGPLLLAGWSMGAMAALEAAAMAAGRVAALVLISGCARFVHEANNPVGQDPRAVRTMLNRLGRGSAKVVERFQNSIFAAGEENMRDLFISGLGNQYQKIPADTLAHGLDYLMTADLRPNLNKITCPVLLVHGIRDTVINLGLAKLLADSLPHARLHALENAGHAPLLSRAGETAGTIVEFIAERQG
jgi:pimeloyl-[acyl-carrier protein] methyl ester esterase